MDSTNAALVAEPEVVGPAALLRGTARGLEWSVDGHATTEAIIAALEAKLAEAPTFFRGSNVRITVDGALANATLVQLAELAGRYDLRIVEIGAPKPALPPAVIVDEPGLPRRGSAAEWQRGVVDSGPMPKPLELAEGSAPTATEEAVQDIEEFIEEPTRTSLPIQQLAMPEGTRLVVGPVRSGVILDHSGNLIVFGDVNPGAEVRATGNIVVLGRLRGTAHAAIGNDTGFILALRLEPQQLRIGRRVARAADNDTGSTDAEIAYATPDQMVVERYQGRLPRNLANSI